VRVDLDFASNDVGQDLVLVVFWEWFTVLFADRTPLVLRFLEFLTLEVSHPKLSRLIKPVFPVNPEDVLAHSLLHVPPMSCPLVRGRVTILDNRKGRL